MLRLVAATDGDLLPDLDGRLPGRGAHLCPDLRCLVQAERNQGFTRTFHTTVRLNDPVLIALTCASAYRQQALELLTLSARIGAMTLSNERTNAALRSGVVALLLIAADASPTVIRRFKKEAEPSQVPTCDDFSTAEISQISFDQPVSCAGVLHRGIARRLNEQLCKMSRLLDSVHSNNNQSQRHLTAKELFEMMPPKIAGQRRGR